MLSPRSARPDSRLVMVKRGPFFGSLIKAMLSLVLVKSSVDPPSPCLSATCCLVLANVLPSTFGDGEVGACPASAGVLSDGVAGVPDCAESAKGSLPSIRSNQQDGLFVRASEPRHIARGDKPAFDGPVADWQGRITQEAVPIGTE